jgi:CheY-like chemotaxis protein
VGCNGGYVLVVDDDLAVQQTIASIVADDYGHNVKTAADGREALGILRDCPPPALIIVDLMMPRMNGLSFLAHKRDQPALASIPLCVMTAMGPSDDELSRMVSAEARGFPVLRKPFDLDELMSLVERYC